MPLISRLAEERSRTSSPGAALDLRLDPEQVRARALRVEVPQQRPVAVARRQVGEVDRRRGLADAALDVVGGEDVAHANVSSHELALRRSTRTTRSSRRTRRAPPLVLLEPLDEHAHRHQRGPATRRADTSSASELSVADLDLAVLMAAEHVLEPLQRPIIGLTTPRRRKRRAEQLEQVAQLLALLAQLVVVLGRARAVDRIAHLDHPAVDLGDPLARHLADRPCGNRPIGVRQRCERRHQRRPRTRDLGCALVSAARGPSRGGRPARRAAQHRRAAGRGRPRIDSGTSARIESNSSTYTSRSRASPVTCWSQRNSVRKCASSAGGNAPRSSRWTDAGAANRDAVVVQELGVDVGERAREVGLHHLEQPPQDRARRRRRRARRGPSGTSILAGLPAGSAAAGDDRLVEQRLAGGPQPELSTSRALRHGASSLS